MLTKFLPSCRFFSLSAAAALHSCSLRRRFSPRPSSPSRRVSNRSPRWRASPNIASQMGSRVLLFPDASKPTATVNITYKVGSRHEGYGETGMAHLLEHMVFKGTPTHANIPQELTERGARPNGTDLVRSHQLLRDLLLEQRQHAMGAGYGVRSDGQFLHPIAATSRRNSPSYATNTRAVRTAPAAPCSTSGCSRRYSSGTTTGTPPSARIRHRRRADRALQAFYRNYYQPDNAVLLSPASSTSEGAELGAGILRADPEADAHARADVHRGSLSRTASAR